MPRSRSYERLAKHGSRLLTRFSAQLDARLPHVQDRSTPLPGAYCLPLGARRGAPRFVPRRPGQARIERRAGEIGQADEHGSTDAATSGQALTALQARAHRSAQAPSLVCESLVDWDGLATLLKFPLTNWLDLIEPGSPRSGRLYRAPGGEVCRFPSFSLALPRLELTERPARRC
jgi:hypothetical protein